jgi:glycerophosphoryl diester phosphodiesterase
MSQENVEVVRGIIDAHRRANFDAVFAAYDPQIEWHVARVTPSASDFEPVYQGQEGVRAFWRTWFAAWESADFEYHEFLDAGQNVVQGSGGRRASLTGTGVVAIRPMTADLAVDGARALPRIYAHRLGGSYGPESGESALRHSLEGAVDGVEADVVLSADGEVFALHDPILSLSTTLAGWAHERDASDLKNARIRDREGQPSEDHPLRLAELLELISRDLPLQLDIKAYADTALAARTARRCCELCREHGTASRLEVISFFTDACTAAVSEGVSARLVIWADYAPQALIGWLIEHELRGIAAEGFILHPRLIGALKDAELTISVGAVNEPIQLARVLEHEPEIVVSDRPHELRENALAHGESA